MNEIDFPAAFEKLTGNQPFPWQRKMYEHMVAGEWDLLATCSLPTGLGKTNAIAVWLIAQANHPNLVPRRLVYVVNRRTVVDQTTDVAVKLRDNAEQAKVTKPAISTLRGQYADNREWSADPSRPAIICGTVDMIGSRLLFSGYGVGYRSRPLHAGFLGQDVLLIHDEAHLEPAFQNLIEAIQVEQCRCNEYAKFRVAALSATARSGAVPFGLTKEEKEVPDKLPEPPTEPIHHVWRRLAAKKGVKLHGVKRDAVAKTIGEAARRRKDPGKDEAVLVFVRTIDDVEMVRDVLLDKKLGVPPSQVEVLTGTLRGRERDALAETNKVFARFQPEPKAERQPGTVFLICTSAGEVGVDISADHMVSDLTPLDSMAQRLGRVNRRGGGQAEIDVVHETDPDPKKKDDEFELARWATKPHLERLPACTWAADRHEASPREIGKLINGLSEEERKAAFAPEPVILPTSDILFDAWALTTIKDKLPGRPKVEPYLHGISEYDPPQTAIAWREEVERLTPEVLARNRLDLEDVFELYPLKPHEELSGPTYGKNKVFEQLEEIAARDAKREPDKRLPAWVIEPDGLVTRYSLQELVEKDNQKKPVVPLGGRTVVLPPRAGGFSGGLLKGDEPFADAIDYDVSAEWYVDAAKTMPRRTRVWSDDERFDEKTKGMRLVRRIDFPPPDGEEDAAVRSWSWFTRPLSADDDGSKTSRVSVTWDDHTRHVTDHATRIANELLKDRADLQRALMLAARFHDLGKKRAVWQRSIGHRLPKEPTSDDWLAKSGKGMTPLELTSYRHEFGSLIDVRDEKQPHIKEFAKLTDDTTKDLVLHLIAAHHGRGRPHFSTVEAFDPGPGGVNSDEIAAEVPRRFARLQRRYGRWGLAYLESLLRAADIAASVEEAKS